MMLSSNNVTEHPEYDSVSDMYEVDCVTESEGCVCWRCESEYPDGFGYVEGDE